MQLTREISIVWRWAQSGNDSVIISCVNCVIHCVVILCVMVSCDWYIRLPLCQSSSLESYVKQTTTLQMCGVLTYLFLPDVWTQPQSKLSITRPLRRICSRLACWIGWVDKIWKLVPNIGTKFFLVPFGEYNHLQKTRFFFKHFWLCKNALLGGGAPPYKVEKKNRFRFGFPYVKRTGLKIQD